MIITSYFTENGAPKTGLTPQLTAWNLAGVMQLNAVAMTEIAGGWYYYDWVAYNDATDYVFRADGGAGLVDFERYNFATNAIAREVYESVSDIFGHVVEGALTFEEYIRVIYAGLANLSGGGGTNTLNFRDLADTKNRILATVDGSGNRLAVVVDGT